MANNNDVIELLDILYGMVTEAWGVPLGNDKCIIEREKAIDIISEIKANLPSSIAEAQRLVSARTSLSATPSARPRRCAQERRGAGARHDRGAGGHTHGESQERGR